MNEDPIIDRAGEDEGNDEPKESIDSEECQDEKPDESPEDINLEAEHNKN